MLINLKWVKIQFLEEFEQFMLILLILSQKMDIPDLVYLLSFPHDLISQWDLHV